MWVKKLVISSFLAYHRIEISVFDIPVYIKWANSRYKGTDHQFF
jgi:hypothetical protein